MCVAMKPQSKFVGGYKGLKHFFFSKTIILPQFLSSKILALSGELNFENPRYQFSLARHISEKGNVTVDENNPLVNLRRSH